MNNLSSKSFFVLALTLLFISTLFSQDRFTDRVTDPSESISQFRHQIPEEHLNPERPFNRPDFQHSRRPWLDKRRQIEDDFRKRFEPKRLTPPFITNKQIVDSVWVNYMKETYTYDANGNRTEMLRQYWENNAWVNNKKWIYTYDANGKMTEWLRQRLMVNNAWVNSWKDTYTYDANENMTERLTQYWVNNAWVNSSKYTYIYDANGKMTERLWQHWENNAWVNITKRTYTHDANGNRTEMLRQHWENNAWVNDWKYTYIYDANGNRTESLTQHWANNAWVNNWKNTYTYDANGKMTERLGQRWENNAWVNSWKYTYIYDANGNMTEWLWQHWVDLLPITYGNTLPKAFKLSQNYPNPFNPVTTIRYELPQFSHVRLSVYDILGWEVAVLEVGDQRPGVREVQWNASNVPSGIYFIQMTAGDFRQVRKVMVLK